MHSYMGCHVSSYWLPHWWLYYYLVRYLCCKQQKQLKLKQKKKKREKIIVKKMERNSVMKITGLQMDLTLTISQKRKLLSIFFLSVTFFCTTSVFLFLSIWDHYGHIPAPNSVECCRQAILTCYLFPILVTKKKRGI